MSKSFTRMASARLRASHRAALVLAVCVGLTAGASSTASVPRTTGTQPGDPEVQNLLRWQTPALAQLSMRNGRAPETSYLVDGDEISVQGFGLDAFFADGGHVEAEARAPMYGVGLKMDGYRADAMTWESYDTQGKTLDRGRVEITWSEDLAHVGRIMLPRRAAGVRLQRNGADVRFMLAQPIIQPMQRGRTLTRDLPLEKITAKLTLPSWVITREQWGARSAPTCGNAHTPRYLTIHHTATPNNDSLTPAARMRQMQAYHMDAVGFCDFGYHFTVGIDGKAYEGRRNPGFTGAHVLDYNTGNVGISVVGTFVDFSPRQSQLDALTNISRVVVDRYGIPKSRNNILGHNEWPTHTSNACPGLLRPWLATLVQNLNGTAPPPPAGVLDSFESSAGRFNSAPTASGSTVGVSTASTTVRSNVQARNGGWSLQTFLRDDANSSASWFVRLLSGGGAPANNSVLQKPGGRLGAWFYTGASGVSVRFTVDDSDGTEISTPVTLQPNTWTWYEVKLDDQAMWDPWAGGNGTITSSSVTLDSVVVERAQASSDVVVYTDDVSFRVQ